MSFLEMVGAATIGCLAIAGICIAGTLMVSHEFRCAFNDGKIISFENSGKTYCVYYVK